MNVLELVTQLTDQANAAGKASENETDLVKSAKALQKAAKMVTDSASYWALVAEGDTENPSLPGHTAESIAQWRNHLDTTAKSLADIATQFAPDSLFDKSKGVSLADQLSLWVKACESGFVADPENLPAVAAALESWGKVKGTASGGPRAAAGKGQLGYNLWTKHATWEKGLRDSTAKGSAMSSALGKLGGDEIKGAARATWETAGKGQTYDDLYAALDRAIAGEDLVTIGDWTVTVEGRQSATPDAAAPESSDTAATASDPTPEPAAV